MKKIPKNLIYLFDNKPEPWNDSQPSAVVPKQFDYKYFNPMTPIIVYLVISLVGYLFKLLGCLGINVSISISCKEIFVSISLLTPWYSLQIK